jgi:hypothetical protein
MFDACAERALLAYFSHGQGAAGRSTIPILLGFWQLMSRNMSRSRLYRDNWHFTARRSSEAYQNRFTENAQRAAVGPYDEEVENRGCALTIEREVTIEIPTNRLMSSTPATVSLAAAASHLGRQLLTLPSHIASGQTLQNTRTQPGFCRCMRPSALLAGRGEAASIFEPLRMVFPLHCLLVPARPQPLYGYIDIDERSSHLNPDSTFVRNDKQHTGFDKQKYLVQWPRFLKHDATPVIWPLLDCGVEEYSPSPSCSLLKVQNITSPSV